MQQSNVESQGKLEQPGKKRGIEVPVAVGKRLALAGNHPMPKHATEAIEEIQTLVARLKRDLCASVVTTDGYDMGRLLHAIDLLHDAQNSAIESVKYPHVQPVTRIL